MNNERKEIISSFLQQKLNTCGSKNRSPNFNDSGKYCVQKKGNKFLNGRKTIEERIYVKIFFLPFSLTLKYHPK